MIYHFHRTHTHMPPPVRSFGFCGSAGHMLRSSDSDAFSHCDIGIKADDERSHVSGVGDGKE